MCGLHFSLTATQQSNINRLQCIVKIVTKLGKCLTCACALSGSMHVVIPPI